MNLFKKYLWVLVLIPLAFLRFGSLGYSEYIPDEGIIINTLKTHGVFSWEFLLDQRKGPMQFVISLIPYVFSKDVYNEFLFRFPYSFANILAIYFFYLFVKEFSKDKYVALVSSYLLGINGFIVAFGRIMQYQNLNLLFSSLCLYMFVKKRYILGSVFFSLSLLSHWDAILILPLVLYLFIKDFTFSNFYKSILTLSLILLPFLMPYGFNYISNTGNKEYFSSRVSSDSLSLELISEKISDYIFKSELYNPFFFLIPLLMFSVFSLIPVVLKKDNEYKNILSVWGWFLLLVIFFILFVKKSGTHIYNFYLPLSILSGYGLVYLVSLLGKIPRVIYVFFVLVWFSFLYYQSFILFVDISKEYPFEQKKILRWETREYTHKNLTNNVIGFNHFRNWENINAKLKEFGATSYYTNEDTSISNFYMEIPYSSESYDYVVGIKRPLSFMNDYKLSNIKGKSTVHDVKSSFGETVVKIYVLDEKDK